jgi:ABC-type nitrate/sulfonate/bicarbonate transport system ATPase subunit
MRTSGVEASGASEGESNATAEPPGLLVRGLSHRFGATEVLEEIDLELPPAGTLALVGPSGCGKSTLLELVAGLAEPSLGTIEIGGERAPARRLARSAYMPQRDLLLPWLRAIDNAALGLRVAGAGRRSSRERARPLLARLGLTGFEDARPDELSGGMRQRIAFVRTLLGGRPLLLLDEPFAALDAITRADLQEWLLAALAAEPRTTLLVTHDVEEALFLADRTLVLAPRPGRVIASASAPPRQGSRAETVTGAAFVEARERCLLALGDAGR